MLRLILLLCASSGLLLEPAAAQAPIASWPPLQGMSKSPLYSQPPITPVEVQLVARPDSVERHITPTHWKEGGLVGAVLLGAFGIWFGNEVCQETEAGQEKGCTVKAVLGGGLGGGAVGFLIGALIGGQFPKHSGAEAETN